MESRKMVLKNLLTGQQWRNRCREYTYGHGEKKGEGEMYGNLYYHMYNRQPTGICCMAQEAQIWALYQPRGVG